MFSKAVSAAALASMVACNTIGAPLNQKAEQMELALLDCKQQLGFPGQTRTVVAFDDGTVSAKVVPFDQIDAAAAAQINDCASRAAVLDDGLVVVPLQAEVAVAPVAVEPARPVAVAAPYVQGSCPAGRTGLYAGTTYCFNGTQ